MGDDTIELVRACQRRGPCHLGGGAALSGAYLAHRLSGDLDLFLHQQDDVRRLASALPDIARETKLQIDIIRDAGTFVRARARGLSDGAGEIVLDLVHESTPDIEAPPPPIDGVIVESLTDLRAAKLTCLLSRSEPRDLVDVMFLERAGFLPERDLAIALRKDGGIDPGILAWLMTQFPVAPLPRMIEPLTVDELRAYRDALAARFRAVAVPKPP